MREIRSSGSVEGVVGDHDPYSDSPRSQRTTPSPKSSTSLWLNFSLLGHLDLREDGPNLMKRRHPYREGDHYFHGLLRQSQPVQSPAK